MLWVAKYKDGRVFKQFDVGKQMSSADLDKDMLESFKITETSGDTSLQFSSDSGILKFSNLDYSKIMNLEGGESLKLVWDKEKESFVFDSESLKFYNTISLKDEKDYFYIMFDQTGVINIHGQPLVIGYIINGEEMPFINQPPYNDFKYIITSNEDFHMGGARVPFKKSSYIISYQLQLNKTHTFNDISFKTSANIIYDIAKGYVILDVLVTSLQDIDGSMFIQIGDKRTANPVGFLKNECKQVRRIIMLL